MILAMAWKSLVAHPVRAAVLGVGFGLGVSVMATLLGVGEVVLDQARSPALVGGGDLVVTGPGGPVTSARFVLGRLRNDAAVVAASPRRRADLFFVTRDGGTVPVGAQGGIPSLERALGDPETASIAGWVDEDHDRMWASPDAASVLRAMDRDRQIASPTNAATPSTDTAPNSSAVPRAQLSTYSIVAWSMRGERTLQSSVARAWAPDALRTPSYARSGTSDKVSYVA